MREQQESVALLRANSLNSDENGDNQNGMIYVLQTKHLRKNNKKK